MGRFLGLCRMQVYFIYSSFSSIDSVLYLVVSLQHQSSRKLMKTFTKYSLLVKWKILTESPEFFASEVQNTYRVSWVLCWWSAKYSQSLLNSLLVKCFFSYSWHRIEDFLFSAIGLLKEFHCYNVVGDDWDLISSVGSSRLLLGVVVWIMYRDRTVV